jgi:hypothetical protein
MSFPFIRLPKLHYDVDAGNYFYDLNPDSPCMNVIVATTAESYEVVQSVRPARTREDDVMRVEAVRVVAVSAVPIVTLIDCS